VGFLAVELDAITKSSISRSKAVFELSVKWTIIGAQVLLYEVVYLQQLMTWMAFWKVGSCRAPVYTVCNYGHRGKIPSFYNYEGVCCSRGIFHPPKLQKEWSRVWMIITEVNKQAAQQPDVSNISNFWMKRLKSKYFRVNKNQNLQPFCAVKLLVKCWRELSCVKKE